jgi:hypothetical protein
MSKAIAVVGSVKRYIVTFLYLVVVAGIFAGADAEETYYTAKYQFPVGIPVGWGGFVLGAGINRDDGNFIGLDVNITNLGYWGGGADVILKAKQRQEGYDAVNFTEDSKYKSCFYGAGLSLGKVYQFSDDIQFVYGGSAGYWYSGEFTVNGDQRNISKVEDLNYTYVSTSSFLAPFVKARWKYLELSYKMFLGVAKATVQLSGMKAEGKSKFDLTHHELSVGVYLAKPKNGE